MEREITVALIQYTIGTDWQENVDQVEYLLRQAKSLGADLAVLPEMFVQPYDMTLIPERAENVPDGPTGQRLSHWAKTLGLAIVGGSVAERDQEKYYNTATLWSPEGVLLAKHRKVHLFDVDLPGGVSFRESSILSPGQQIIVSRVSGLNIGLAVCYDIRFPELHRIMALAGVEFIAVPGAFNHVSGPAHWELLIRTRAMENTIYVAAVSGLSPEGASYNAWGHSMLVGPFGEIITHMGVANGVALGKLDPQRLVDIRARLPVMAQRRPDVYRLEAIPHGDSP